MSDNKFIQRLKGQQTPKSVVEVQNDKLVAPFTGVPYSTDVVGAIVDDKDSSVVVAKGAQNWKLDGSSLVTASSLTGDGADYTGEFNASGSGLWINATYSLPATIFTAGTKWVLKLCGKNLLTTSGETIGFTLVVKVGNTHITSKTFLIPEGANVFCRQMVIDFSESEQSIIKAQSGDKLTLQLLCSDTNASATIYNGMTVLTALQRRVDADVIASDDRTFDEVVQDIIDINDDIDQINDNIEQINDDIDQIRDDIDNLDDTFVLKTGDTMTGALNIANIASSNSALLTLTHSNTATYKWNIAPRYNSTTLSIYPGSTETNGFRFATTGFVPSSNNARYLGSASLKWKGVYTGVLNNGADLVVPNKAGTLATMDDVELAARSGTQLTDQGVWYAKMYAATVAPSAKDGTNYADFSQVDGQGNPIIVTYNRVNGAWVQDQTITPPAEYDGYVLVTSKIWDIAEQAGQQGGRVLWNHTSKEFTPYPQIISFEDIEVTGDSTVIMPQNPGANQIVNKRYVDEAIASIPTPTVDVLLSPDIKIVGSLTQNGSVFSGFSTNDYFTLPWERVDFRQPFEFVIGANITAGTLNQSVARFGTNYNYSRFSLFYSGSTGELNFNGRSDNSIQISGVVPTDTDCLIKISWSGAEYKMFVSTNNGETYTQIGSTVSSTSDCGYGDLLMIGKDGGTQYYESFLGTINLSGAYLKVSGTIIWSGMDAPGLHQRVPTGHEVIAFQAPTVGNNYTWYRKYADGWVEQGGTASDRQGSVVLPVTMSDANYMISQTLRLSGSVPGSAQICPYVKNVSSTGFDFYNNPTGTVVWQVSGMAA